MSESVMCSEVTLCRCLVASSREVEEGKTPTYVFSFVPIKAGSCPRILRITEELWLTHAGISKVLWTNLGTLKDLLCEYLMISSKLERFKRHWRILQSSEEGRLNKRPDCHSKPKILYLTVLPLIITMALSSMDSCQRVVWDWYVSNLISLPRCSLKTAGRGSSQHTERWEQF